MSTVLARQLLEWPEQRSVYEQKQSPLFKLPPEVRAIILELAVTSYADWDRIYPANTHYFRPGYECDVKTDTHVLATCRAIYLEACHLPLSVNKLVFWAYRGPRGEPPSQNGSGLHSAQATGHLTTTLLEYDEDDTPWHFDFLRRNADIPIHHIRRAHWFTQQYWLECDNFLSMMQSVEMSNLEELTLTVRRGDQWNFTEFQKIGIDPRFPAAVTEKRMKEIWARDIAGNPMAYHPDAWGSHIRHLPQLKNFVLEIEGEEFQEDELVAIVNHAKQYWTFLHYSGQQMTLQSVRTTRWVGPSCLVAHRSSVTPWKKARLVIYSMTFRLPSV